MTEFAFNFPFFSILLALISAVASSILSAKAARRICMGLLIVEILLSCGTLAYTWQTQEGFSFMMGHFPAPWGNELYSGILEPIFALTFSSVIFFSVIGGRQSLAEELPGQKINIYYIMIDLLTAAIMSLVYTNDLFTGYVFIEISTIASTAVLMIRDKGRTIVATTRYLIFSLLGSGLVLISVILLYAITGHLLIPQLHDAVQTLVATGAYAIPLKAVITLITIGLCIKCGLFPFHFWMLDTYSYAPVTSAGILSGVVSKAYIVLLIKVVVRVFGLPLFVSSGAAAMIFVLGAISVILGSLYAVSSVWINRMNACSSIAQIGYIFMAIGMGSELGLCAAVIHIIAHAVTKPALFQCGDSLSRTAGDHNIAHMRGAGRKNLWASIPFTAAAFSMIGIPCFVGFISKLMFAQAAIELPQWTMTVLIILAVSTLLNTIYFFRTVMIIFMPKAPDSPAFTSFKNDLKFKLSVCFFTITNVVIGMYSGPLTTLIARGFSIL